MTLASGLVLSAAASWTMLASCAATDAEGPPSNDTSNRLDASPELDAGDAQSPVDGGCDASDPSCVTKPVSCAEADWCPVPTNVSTFYALTSVWGSGKNDVWATGSGGTVIHWDGNTWTSTTVPSGTSQPTKDTFHALWGSGPNDVWIASASDRIFHSDGFVNGTATWVQAPSATASDFDRMTLYAAWGTSAEDVRFGGSSSFSDTGELVNQVVRKPSEGGIEWTRAGGLATIHGIWGASADDVWVISDSRPYGSQVGMTVHGTRTGGGDFVWQEVDSRASVVLNGIWGSSASDIWIVGDNGTIRHFGPNATEWAIVRSPTQEKLEAVWGSGPNDVWVVGDSGTILHWNGTEWGSSVAAFPVNRNKPHLYGVWGSGPTDVWIVGDDIALHYTGTKGGAK